MREITTNDALSWNMAADCLEENGHEEEATLLRGSMLTVNGEVFPLLNGQLRDSLQDDLDRQRMNNILHGRGEYGPLFEPLSRGWSLDLQFYSWTVVPEWQQATIEISQAWKPNDSLTCVGSAISQPEQHQVYFPLPPGWPTPYGVQVTMRLNEQPAIVAPPSGEA